MKYSISFAKIYHIERILFPWTPRKSRVIQYRRVENNENSLYLMWRHCHSQERRRENQNERVDGWTIRFG